MKKCLGIIAITLSLLVLTILILYALRPVRPRPTPPPPRPLSTLEKSGWKRMSLDPYREKITEERRKRIKSAVAGIHEACVNGDVELMRQRMMDFPRDVTNVHNQVYLELITPLHTFLHDSIFSRELRDFTQLQSFELFMRISLELARFMGNTYFAREQYVNSLDLLECRALRQLNAYRDKFMAENRADLAECAQKFIAELIEHIESKDGFTRRYMWYQVSLQFGKVELSGWTSERLIFFVRSNWGEEIVCEGYTPKWMDEEFPLTPEYAELLESRRIKLLKRRQGK